MQFSYEMLLCCCISRFLSNVSISRNLSSLFFQLEGKGCHLLKIAVHVEVRKQYISNQIYTFLDKSKEIFCDISYFLDETGSEMGRKATGVVINDYETYCK